MASRVGGLVGEGWCCVMYIALVEMQGQNLHFEAFEIIFVVLWLILGEPRV